MEQNTPITGRIHSVETFGLVDGPACGMSWFGAGLCHALPLLP